MIEKGIVKERNGSNLNVELPNGQTLEMPILRLFVGSKNFLAMPEPGTIVICWLGNINLVLGAIYSTETIPDVSDNEILFVNDSLKLSLSGDKMSLSNAQSSLKVALNNLIDTVSNLTTVVPNGTGVVSAASKTSLAADKTSLNQILT